MQSTNNQNHSAPQLACRGVRGATTVSANTAEQIVSATSELLQTIMVYNEMEAEDIASIFFTTSSDLTATFPAVGARNLGLLHTALLCGHEMQVPGGLPMCIRVMIHWNTTKTQKQVVNVYLNEAKKLRPDHELPTVRPKQIDPMKAMVKALENKG